MGETVSWIKLLLEEVNNREDLISDLVVEGDIVVSGLGSGNFRVYSKTRVYFPVSDGRGQVYFFIALQPGTGEDYISVYINGGTNG